ncbi:hypothetical protein ACFLR4_01355 [Bacteroidota bacterium]
MKKKTKLKLFSSVILILSSIVSAFILVGEVRLVIILTLFFGGFGAGATLTLFIRDLKAERKRLNDEHKKS